jgi:hypothetical protein
MEPMYDPGPLWVAWAAMMSVGLLVWWLGLRARSRTFGNQAIKPTTGTTEVQKPPTELSRELARSLAAQGAGFSARITSCDERELRAELRPLVVAHHGLGYWQREGFASLVCHLSPSGSRGSRMEWSVDGSRLLSPLRPWSTAIALAGLLALVAAGILMPVLVIPDPRPDVHFQVFQTIQVVHFLWPPFLVSTIAQRLRTQIEQRAADWLANLAYLD